MYPRPRASAKSAANRHPRESGNPERIDFKVTGFPIEAFGNDTWITGRVSNLPMNLGRICRGLDPRPRHIRHAMYPPRGRGTPPSSPRTRGERDQEDGISVCLVGETDLISRERGEQSADEVGAGEGGDLGDRERVRSTERASTGMFTNTCRAAQHRI